MCTLFAAIYIAKEGNQYFGVTAAHDPIPWIVLAAGVAVSLIFAGLGYSLGMLCALYDRQTTAAQLTHSVLGSLGSISRPSTEWRAPAAREPALREAPAPSLPKADAALVIAPVRPRSGLWAALTKERHLWKQRY
jgi:hypothetical protein